MTIPTIFLISLSAIAWIILAIAVSNSLFVVRTQTATVVERFGKFKKVANAGLNFKLPFVDRKVSEQSLRVQQFDLTVNTKTKDNVFVDVSISIQLQVPQDRAADAYYKLTDVQQQVSAYADNVVLAHVPSMDFDDVFNNAQATIGNFLKGELEASLKPFGYDVVKVLIKQVVAPSNVRAAMDNINASRRNQVANEAQGEAEKIIMIKRAEAEAKSKALQGEGIAAQRQAIINGLKKSVEDFSSATGVGPDEVMSLVLLTQYLDTLKEIGANGRSTTILIPHSPSAVKDLFSQIRDGIITANQVTPAKI